MLFREKGTTSSPDSANARVTEKHVSSSRLIQHCFVDPVDSSLSSPSMPVAPKTPTFWYDIVFRFV